MIKAVYISRIPDGLPLIASMGNEQLYTEYSDYKNQFKNITRSICDGTIQEPQCTLAAGSFSFHVEVDLNVIYICLTEKGFPKKDAFSFLDSVRLRFRQEYTQDQIETCNRPFSLLKFENELEMLKKDSHSANPLHVLNKELTDVSRIMSKNIDDLVMRGEKISKLSDLTSRLSSESSKYAKDARMLNLRAMYRKYAPIVITRIVVFLVWCFYKALF